MKEKITVDKQVNLIHTHINSIRTLTTKLERSNLKTAKYSGLFESNISTILETCREMELAVRKMLGNIK